MSTSPTRRSLAATSPPPRSPTPDELDLMSRARELDSMSATS